MTTDVNGVGPFATLEGWNEYKRRMTLLHGMPTNGQKHAIIREVKEWERNQLGMFSREQEYEDIMRANELYEKLIKEG